MRLLTSKSVIQVRLDVLHLLNDIHNNEYYQDIGRIITPQGLLALLLSIAPLPGWSTTCLEILESMDHTCISKHKHLDSLQIFLEQLVQEVDVQTYFLFQKYNAKTSSQFFNWTGLSCISLIASSNPSDQSAIQELSKSRFHQFRYYDGYHAVSGGNGLNL